MATLRLKRFDLSFRTAYAQAKELALAQHEVSLLTAGSILVEKRGNSRFAYRYRYDATGKRIAEYLGPEDNHETARKIAAVEDEVQGAKTLSRYSQDLRRVGFYSADNSTAITVAGLFNAGVFNGAALVGSHAFGALLNELGVSVPFPMTEDIDIARSEQIQVAALPEGGFLELLRETGLPFHEVPELKRGAPSTSFKVRGRPLKVDLLVPAKGESYKTVKVPELKAHATGLSFLDFLVEGAGRSVLLARDRIVPIVIPDAGRYCIHKLAVYSLRPSSDSAKRDKDAFQAATLAAALSDGQDFLLVAAMEAMNRSLRAKVRAGARRALEWLGTDYAAAATIIETLA
jgi:hypothetical protein